VRKITRGQTKKLYEFFNLVSKLTDLPINHEYKVSLSSNVLFAISGLLEDMKSIVDRVETVRANIFTEEFSEKFTEYSKERDATLLPYAVKNDKGQFLIKNGVVVLTPEGEELAKT
jgi:alpha-N-acetylglucosamine transferase